MVKLKFKKLIENAIIPSYAHDGDIGLDVVAVSFEYDAATDCYIYHTGLACETTGHVGLLGMMRSSIYKKGGFYLTNAVGLIDSDQYRGEILFIFRRSGGTEAWVNRYAEGDWKSRPFLFRLTHCKSKFIEAARSRWFDIAAHVGPYFVGEKIGQLVPIAFDKAEIVESDSLSETERGSGGFGSTDRKEA